MKAVHKRAKTLFSRGNKSLDKELELRFRSSSVKSGLETQENTEGEGGRPCNRCLGEAGIAALGGRAEGLLFFYGTDFSF